MTLILSGTDGLSDVDGTAATPAIRGTDTNTGIFFPAADTIAFSEGGTEAMRIDSSGNVGVGVTPGTWSDGKVIEINTAGNALWGEGNYTVLLQNARYNGGYKYARTGVASSHYDLEGGSHKWYTAPSGTAGNAISFTQAMTLDASGNLGVGTSSPSGNGRLELNVPSGSNTNLTFYENGSSRWLIGSLTGSNAFRFYDLANASERARITSTGIFFVGVTSQQGGGSHCIQAGTGVNSLQMQNNGAIPYGPYINFSAAAPNNASQYFIQCTDTAATRVLLYSNGGLANYQANNVNLSDRREKTNFAPAGEYLSKICAIPVQTFNYIDQSEDDPGLTLGVVAQDVQAVAPELVMESNWGTKDDPKMRLSIYQTDLQYALMKCIQELKAINDAQAQTIQSLTARIEALEGK